MRGEWSSAHSADHGGRAPICVDSAPIQTRECTVTVVPNGIAPERSSDEVKDAAQLRGVRSTLRRIDKRLVIKLLRGELAGSSCEFFDRHRAGGRDSPICGGRLRPHGNRSGCSSKQSDSNKPGDRSMLCHGNISVPQPTVVGHLNPAKVQRQRAKVDRNKGQHGWTSDEQPANDSRAPHHPS